jgi:hypothetical protein
MNTENNLQHPHISWSNMECEFLVLWKRKECMMPFSYTHVSSYFYTFVTIMPFNFFLIFFKILGNFLGPTYLNNT